jgi:hemolysin activation/secretion protein
LLEAPETPPTPPPSVAGETVTITGVKVLGNTVFEDEEIAEVIKPFIGTEAAFEDLLAIRTAITNLYTRRGYTTSGAFLPPQDVSEGIITVQVVEGELEEIEISGLERLDEDYARSRILKAGKSPVNIQQLEQALQLLQLNPLFSRVQAELKAGTSPGQSVLTLILTEADAFSAAYFVSNSQSPSVGSVRNSAVVSHQNLLGFGDSLIAEFGLTEETTEYSVDYAFPINHNNGELTFRYSQGDQLVVEEPFADFELNSDTESYSLGIRQPLIYTPTEEFALGLSLDLRRSQTFLLEDLPFSFSIGPENGESKVSVLRFSQDWTKRSRSRVFAARSQFNFGLDIFDATVNNTGTDGLFFSWLGQFQWVQALNSAGLVQFGRNN